MGTTEFDDVFIRPEVCIAVPFSIVPCRPIASREIYRLIQFVDWFTSRRRQQLRLRRRVADLSSPSLSRQPNAIRITEVHSPLVCSFIRRSVHSRRISFQTWTPPMLRPSVVNGMDLQRKSNDGDADDDARCRGDVTADRVNRTSKICWLAGWRQPTGSAPESCRLPAALMF